MNAIATIETFPVPPRWLFIRVQTTAGIVGWGEASLEGHTEPVAAAFVSLRERFCGVDADRIEDIWQTAYRLGFYRGGPVLMSALAGLDQALWDIKGKTLGAPVWQLLGGRVRDRIKAYAWIGGDTPNEIAGQAEARLAQGFRAVKMNATGPIDWIENSKCLDATIERVARVNAAGLDVAIDFHGRLHKPMAKQLVALLEQQRQRPLFIEEPLLSEHVEALQELSGFTSIPIALGERLYNRWDFKTLLKTGIVDVVQPDLSHAGGISECRRIANFAEAYDVCVAPHSPLGPIALAACLQLATATPNFVIQEVSLGIHYNTADHDLLTYLRDKSVFRIKDGCLEVPKMPGLGIDIDEERVRHASLNCPPWRNPVWRGEDGSVREW